MPDNKTSFPKWQPADLRKLLPEMDERGLHLLNSMLQIDPERRISGASLFLGGPREPSPPTRSGGELNSSLVAVFSRVASQRNPLCGIHTSTPLHQRRGRRRNRTRSRRHRF